MPQKTLLAIGAHHDDCEYAAGGLILKAVQRGYRVVLVMLTGDHASWKPTADRPAEVRRRLLDLAGDMGVEKRFYDWGYHQLRYDDHFLRPLVELAVELNPQIALIHWPHDYWPDHEIAWRLAKHALWFPHGPPMERMASRPSPRLLAFEAGPNQTDPSVPFRPDVYIDVSDVMDRVAAIIRRVDSIASGQEISGPSSHELDKLGKCKVRGSECDVAYAEAFLALKKWPQELL